MKAAVDRTIEEKGLPEAAAQNRVAAILFTYRCTIACRHCLFGCAGDRPDVVMAPASCARNLALLHETGRVVHIAGGEAMLYWDVLAESVALAGEAGVSPHFIETNCSFAVDDALVRDRFSYLLGHGVMGIYASSDPYHQEHVPPDRFTRVRRLAFEVFGEGRFFGPGHSDDEALDLAEVAGNESRLRDYVRAHPPNMVGTASRRLSTYLDGYAADDPELPKRGWRGSSDDTGCAREFGAETMWELHIDPYGNLQTNCGIILGNVSEVSPAALLAAGPGAANRFVRVACESGGRGLAALARREYGFVMPDRVAQACELCFIARRFLHKHHPEVFGPAEVYC